MRVQKTIAPILLVALVIGVALASFISFRQQHAAEQAAREAASVATVRGLVGSEKKDFLTDPRVIAVFRRNGIDLQVDTAGSRDIATRPDLSAYDFGFPAGVPAAKKLMQAKHVSQSFSPFFTPMVVASWRPIGRILIANGIVKQLGADFYIVDMKGLIRLIAERKRWNELAHHEAYDVGKSILISSTDVRQSNSAAMYLALASYLLNDNEIVANEAQVAKVMPAAAGLFLRQGYQESSSAGPFEDYTTIGMGKSPLVMVYEAQFIEYLIEHPNARNPDMILLYPKPTVYTKHELVPFDELGAKVGRLLESDPDLQRLAVEHGLRTADAAYAKDFWRKNGVHAPDTLIDVVDPPSYEILESMIREIERQFNNA
ncbi:MAG: hypothetical protein ACLPYS_12610 [Vulcanimicrobiaceae bacterium]